MKKHPQKDNRKKISKQELDKKIREKLFARGITDPENATEDQLYHAVVYVLKDIILEARNEYKRQIKEAGVKKICYLCMEFLVGRSLKNYAENLGVFDALCAVLEEYGPGFERIYACETDPGLGNGGLGRLAACFMDSLAACDYAANGYSLLYENGLFKQKIVEGEQVELPDEWLATGGAWLVVHPEKSVTVRLGGKILESFENGGLKITHYDYQEVKAVPYDMLIPGTVSGAVNTIRFWRARAPHRFVSEHNESQGSYFKYLTDTAEAQIITKQLYPPDDYDEGKLLRLSQQYFLVSASLQSILRDYLADHGSLQGLEDKISLHINDTHPALCIPELMRILMDIYSYSWDEAWRVVKKMVSYTNHTVLPEALECWREDLFQLKLPRIYSIVCEINRRFTAELWNLYPGDWDRISRMSVIAYGQVRMANLSVVGSHTVNGVSKLHSEILKQTIFHDFYKMTPDKFKNVTNGVVHRRWLNSANPALCTLLDELIGPDYREDAMQLSALRAYSDDTSVLKRLAEIKRYNKERFAHYAFASAGIRLDPDSVFDVQIKRMHEYKRQLLNVLKILNLYGILLENPNTDLPKQTFIFGCKAAPGYAMAKKIIKLIWCLAKEIEKTPSVREKLKIVFMEEYNVSMAEIMIPSADISEQISLAGKEASGTGCMKLMMNGALTLGTLDGANVEILEAVGNENIYIFGLNTAEVEQLWRNGYFAREYYHNSVALRRAVDRLYSPIGGCDFRHIADYFIGGFGVADPFMCLADFDSYMNAYGRALNDTRDILHWNRMSLMNVAASGVFSSDQSVKKYATDIWRMPPVKTVG